METEQVVSVILYDDCTTTGFRTDTYPGPRYRVEAAGSWVAVIGQDSDGDENYAMYYPAHRVHDVEVYLREVAE
jgi:hypothetical protein